VGVPTKHSHLRDEAFLRQVVVNCLHQAADTLVRDEVHVRGVCERERGSAVVTIYVRRTVRNYQDVLLLSSFHLNIFVSFCGSDPQVKQLLHILPAGIA
jgi:hypothetical protein